MPETPAATRDFFAKYRPSGVPGLTKYAQLREMFHAALKAGHWKPGDRLPTEAELANLSPFSLGTVQRALRALVDEGLVVRTQGSGTFVAESRAPIDAPLHLRFRGVEGEPEFLPLFPKALGRRRVAERGPWSEPLKQKGDEIVCIERRLSVNREFDVYNRFYFSADTFPAVSQKSLSALDGANLKQLLASVSSMPVTHVEQTITLAKLPPEALKALSLKPGTRGMLLESVAFAGRGLALYYLESWIPPNPRKLDVNAP